LLLGSTNPLILDIIGSKIAGYDPMIVPTSRTAFFRKNWLNSMEEIIYDGPELNTIIKKDFLRIPVSANSNIALQFVMKRIKPLKKLERRPVFLHDKCTGCEKCIKICPVNAINMHSSNPNYVVLSDNNCIRCFCCSEVCMDNAVEIRRKVFGE
jgi:ferredoxin